MSRPSVLDLLLLAHCGEDPLDFVVVVSCDHHIINVIDEEIAAALLALVHALVDARLHKSDA